jgi:hypothetical protein
MLVMPDARESETYRGYAEGIPVEKESEQEATQSKPASQATRLNKKRAGEALYQ